MHKHERHITPAQEPRLVIGIPLTEAPLNAPLRIAGISGGHQAQTRLASMGILPGETIEIVRRDNGGPLLVEVKGARVALGRGISLKVTVER